MNKKSIGLLLVVSMALVLLVSCSTVSEFFRTKVRREKPAVEETVAEETTEDEEEPEIVIGPIFISRKAEIVLEGNPTTGYTWTVYPDNSGVYEVVSEKFEPFSTAEGMVGVGGHYIAELKSLKEGTGTVALEYARGWENAPLKRFEFKIMVDATGRFTVAENE